MKEYQELLLNFFADDSYDAEIKSRKFINKLMDLIVDADYEKMIELYKTTKNMKYSGQGFIESVEKFDEEKRKLFIIGYIYALLDAMQIYTEKLQVENEIHEVKTKYKDLVLYILASRGILFHKDLASAIGVSVSGLNAIIKQMNATSVKLVRVEEVSKFKLYSLTPAAHQYMLKHNINAYMESRKESNRDFMCEKRRKIKWWQLAIQIF